MNRWLIFLYLTFWLTPANYAANPGVAENSEQEATTDEALLEFLGAMEQLNDWNEFFDMAEDGLPPEFPEADGE